MHLDRTTYNPPSIDLKLILDLPYIEGYIKRFSKFLEGYIDLTIKILSDIISKAKRRCQDFEAVEEYDAKVVSKNTHRSAKHRRERLSTH